MSVRTPERRVSNSREKRSALRRTSVGRSRIGQFEHLESRSLLSVGPHPRIINGDEIDDSFPRIINGSPTSGFTSVGEIGERTRFYCTGTLIAPEFVLTAGHCADDVSASDGRFAVGGTTYSTSQIFLHPAYNGNRIGVDDSANDLAIFRLNTAVTDVAPSLIFRGTPRVGEVLTLVGLGAGGDGDGHDGSFGTKRMGTTPIDGVTQRRILWTFDDNSESNTAPGDSGGPAYLEFDGVLYVAGVTSGGSRSNAGIGDRSYDTRVDFYASWIDSIVGDTAPPDPDPDPGNDDHADQPGPDATVIDFSADGTFQAFGTLELAGDRDVFQVEVTEVGQLTVMLASASDSLDTYLRVFDAAGQQIAFDDDSGPATDSQLGLSVDPGIYYITAGSYLEKDAGDYVVDGTFVHDDHGDTTTAATEIVLGLAGDGMGTGTLERSGDRDFFKFVAFRGGSVAIDLRASVSDLDTVLNVYDSRGRRISSNDDSFGGSDSHVQFRAKAGRTYFVEAAGYRDSQGEYSLSIAPTTGGRNRRSQSRSADARAFTRFVALSEQSTITPVTHGADTHAQVSSSASQPATAADTAIARPRDHDEFDIDRRHSRLSDIIDLILAGQP
jgi:hypothetical protein